MASLIKLVIVSKSSEVASFFRNRLVFLHLLYTLVEKQPYLMSTSSYQLSIKHFIVHMHLILMVFYKNHVRQNRG